MSSVGPQRGIATETRRQLNTLRNTLLSRSFQHWPIALALLYNHPVLFRERVQLQETTPVTEESRGTFLSHPGYFNAPVLILKRAQPYISVVCPVGLTLLPLIMITSERRITDELPTTKIMFVNLTTFINCTVSMRNENEDAVIAFAWPRYGKLW